MKNVGAILFEGTPTPLYAHRGGNKPVDESSPAWLRALAARNAKTKAATKSDDETGECEG